MNKKLIISDELRGNVVNYFKTNRDNRISIMAKVFEQKERTIQIIIDSYLKSLQITKVCNKELN